MCRKVRYTTRAQARDVAIKLRRRETDPARAKLLGPYWHAECEAYHVGHRPEVRLTLKERMERFEKVGLRKSRGDY